MSKRKSGSNEGNEGLLAWLKKGKSENKSHGNVTKSSSADTAKETETKEEEKETFIITEAATEPTLSLSPSSDSISNVTVSVVTNASYSDTKSDGKVTFSADNSCMQSSSKSSASAAAETADNYNNVTTEAVHISKEYKTESFYHGEKLNLSELCKQHSCLKQYVLKSGGRNHRYVKCEICEQYVNIAIKNSKNGTCPLASGIRADERKRLELVRDHLHSQCHSAVVEHMRLEKLYEQQSKKHPWINTLKKHQAAVIDHLIKLSIDVYNDSLYETLTAHNWPARSLAQLHAATVTRDMDAPFVSYSPSASDLHYRDPLVYQEMLEVVGDMQKQSLREELKSAIAFAIKLDGSADRRMVDNKFTSVRYVKGPPTYELCTGFLKVSQPEKGGAEGLLEAALDALEDTDTSKLIGITTDGESANTGKDKGLWKLLSNALNRNLLSIWCIAHRSDLAMENIIVTVPQLKIWKSNLKSVSTYYRTSSKRTKKLSVIQPDCKAFPAHFDVRFVEHLCNLIEAIIFNLSGCRSHWNDLVENGERLEKPEARGFLKVWEKNSVQHWLTIVMADVCSIFRQLQKQLQRSDLIMPDILTCRDSAIRKLQLMEQGPYPGGFEYKLLQDMSVQEPADKDNLYVQEENQIGHATRSLRQTNNANVLTNRRDRTAIRNEIVQCSLNFLQARMSVEQDKTITAMKGMLLATSPMDMINAGLQIVNDLFPDESA